MNKSKMKVSILTAMLFALMIMVAAPATFAQGKGRGHGRGRHSNYDKKCGKFVNCHDARDGRVDGRGPNRNGSWRDRIYGARGTRVRNRRFNDTDFRNRRADLTRAQRRAWLRRNR
jgi:hypothetical protein